MKRIFLFCFAFLCNLLLQANSTTSCNIIHPELAVFDYQPNAADEKEWYIIRDDATRVKPEQKDYLKRKLLLANHQSPFSDKATYGADRTADWKKLHCYVLKFFKNKSISKEWLAVVCIERGDNLWRGHQSCESLPLQTDEYFVFPMSALESYHWPNGKLSAYDSKNNIIDEIIILGPERKTRYERMSYDARNKRLDPDTFCTASLESLKQFCGNDDLYREMLYMGSLKNTYHELLSGGKRINLMQGSSDWKAHDAIILYSIGTFTIGGNREITVQVAPFDENDVLDDMGPYRGSTNHRDCYYFIESGSIDKIGTGNELGQTLARIIIASENNFKGLEEPKRGYFERIQGYSYLGKETAKGYAFGLIDDGSKLYFLNDGRLQDAASAEDAYQKAIKQLDTIYLPQYGKLNKGPETNNANDSGVSTKYTMYELNSNGHQYALLAMYIHFKDDFYLCGIEVMKVQ